MTFVGQALGRKDTKEAKNWGGVVAKIGFIGICMYEFPLGIPANFIVDAITLPMAIIPLKITGILDFPLDYIT